VVLRVFLCGRGKQKKKKKLEKDVIAFAPDHASTSMLPCVFPASCFELVSETRVSWEKKKKSKRSEGREKGMEHGQ
jgi:hypothetical protein